MSTFVFPTVTANGWSSPSPPTGMGTLFAVTTDCNAAVQFDASSRIWPVSSLTAVKVAPAPAINDPSLRLVIRLWPTSYQVEAAGDLPVSLWIGIVTLERLEHPGGIATLAMTDQDFGMPTAQLAQSLQTLGVRLNIKRAGTTAVLLAR